MAEGAKRAKKGWPSMSWPNAFEKGARPRLLRKRMMDAASRDNDFPVTGTQ